MSADMAVPLELMSRVERYLVYRCYSNDGALLYAGRTGRGGKRLAEHADRVWFLGVRAVTFEWYADELDARNAERLAIQVEHPRYNMQHRNSKPQSVRPHVAAVVPKQARATGRKEPSSELITRLLPQAREVSERWRTANNGWDMSSQAMADELHTHKTTANALLKVIQAERDGGSRAVAQ